MSKVSGQIVDKVTGKVLANIEDVQFTRTEGKPGVYEISGVTVEGNIKIDGLRLNRELQDPGGDSNPIRLEDGKWWWYDEVWVSRNGPFDTKAQAEAELDKYVKENL